MRGTRPSASLRDILKAKNYYLYHHPHPSPLPSRARGLKYSTNKEKNVATLQYVIDSLCSKLTVESMFEIIRQRLIQGPFKIDEIILIVRSKDRSLDYDSAKMIAEAAIRDLSQSGEIKVYGQSIFPAT